MLMDEISRPERLTSVTETVTSFSPQPVRSSRHRTAANSTRSRFLTFFMMILPD